MRELRPTEFDYVSGSGGPENTYNLPGGATAITALQPDKSTTLTVQIGGHTHSFNSGQELTKFMAGAGVGAMAAPLAIAFGPPGIVAAAALAAGARAGTGALMKN